MRTLFGLELVESDLAVEHVRVERRVPGGYLNRWLVREVTVERRPCAYVINPGAVGLQIMGSGEPRYIIHPHLAAKLRYEAARDNPGEKPW